MTKVQAEILRKMKAGAIINHFRGIGTKYKPSAELLSPDGGKIMTVSVATLKAIRDYITEFNREFCHSRYKIKD